MKKGTIVVIVIVVVITIAAIIAWYSGIFKPKDGDTKEVIITPEVEARLPYPDALATIRKRGLTPTLIKRTRTKQGRAVGDTVNPSEMVEEIIDAKELTEAESKKVRDLKGTISVLEALLLPPNPTPTTGYAWSINQQIKNLNKQIENIVT